VTRNYLAVDLGASSGRLVRGSWDGRRFALDEVHRFSNGPVQANGRYYSDVLRLWSEILEGLRRYARDADEAPAGIGVDTWGVDYALLDAGGALVGNPYHYRDPRTEGMVELACELLGRERIFGRTGIQFMPINGLIQLLASREMDDPQLQVADTLLMIPDLFNYWLSGRPVAEITIASTSQLLDATTRGWAVDLLDDLGIPSRILPELVEPGSELGPLLPAVAAEAGFARFERPTPVFATGSHDTASAVAAVPHLDERSLYLSSGTWSLIGVETDRPVLGARALALNVTNEAGVGGRIRLLKNVMGLWILEECRRQWRREGRDPALGELLAQAEAAPPFRSLVDPDAAEFLAPGDMPAALRGYCRRSGQPEPADDGALVRCILESLALRYRWVCGALEELTGRSLDTIRVVGGGSRNRLLNQLSADICDRPVVAGPVEATALGNVMVQAIATGDLPDIEAGRAAVADSVTLQRYEPQNLPGVDEAVLRFAGLGG
jgi:rhamnulokinase